MVNGKKRQALGKGLGALLQTNGGAEILTEGRSYLICPIEKVRPNRYQPRKSFDNAQLAELASSIREKGIIQPLIVRTAGADGYELIAGERRWRAAQKAGLREVPVVVKDVSDSESLEIAIVENIQRAELNPVEEAEGYKQLMQEFSYTQEDIAARVGKDRATISNHLRILKLPAEVKREISRGSISLGHAKALLSLEREEDIRGVKNRIIKRGISVRETESLVKRLKDGKRKAGKSGTAAREPDIIRLEERLAAFLGTKVRIIQKGERGRIEVEFYSGEEFEGLLDRIGFNNN